MTHHYPGVQLSSTSATSGPALRPNTADSAVGLAGSEIEPELEPRTISGWWRREGAGFKLT